MEREDVAPPVPIEVTKEYLVGFFRRASKEPPLGQSGRRIIPGLARGQKKVIFAIGIEIEMPRHRHVGTSAHLFCRVIAIEVVAENVEPGGKTIPVVTVSVGVEPLERVRWVLP